MYKYIHMSKALCTCVYVYNMYIHTYTFVYMFIYTRNIVVASCYICIFFLD